jgi:7-cyano-7-deazaguanine synthase in queuosine biosynthesis
MCLAMLVGDIFKRGKTYTGKTTQCGNCGNCGKRVSVWMLFHPEFTGTISQD